MKKIITSIITAGLCLVCAAQSSLHIGQYNIRNNRNKDAENGNGWEVRLQKICDVVNYESWDIWGSQEVYNDQLNDLIKGTDGYDYIGVGRNDGATKGEYAPIFYKKSRIKCLDQGTFWLSETPDVVASKGWDASLCRICTWGKFEDKTTKWKFWVFNLHMDHRGVEARREGSKLVLRKIAEMCGDEPYILTGDFNVNQKNEIYSILTGSGALRDCYEIARHRMAETGPMNYYVPDYKTDNRIDHIFVSPHFKVHEYGVLTYTYWQPIELTQEAKDDIAKGVEGVPEHRARMLSDHYPVAARVELPKLRSPQDWANYRFYAKENETDKNVKVVFMGDSITEGWRFYHSEFFTENPYICRGIGGQVTAQMLARFRSDVINHDPEAVVILAGTNDIAMNQGYVPLEQIFENIVSMVELAQFNGIKVVLCSLLPADRYSWSWELSKERTIESIAKLNTMLEEYAAENKIPFADFYTSFCDENKAMKKEYQKDAVHPNKEGYLEMERIIYPILKKVIKRSK